MSPRVRYFRYQRRKDGFRRRYLSKEEARAAWLKGAQVYRLVGRMVCEYP